MTDETQLQLARSVQALTLGWMHRARAIFAASAAAQPATIAALDRQYALALAERVCADIGLPSPGGQVRTPWEASSVRRPPHAAPARPGKVQPRRERG